MRGFVRADLPGFLDGMQGEVVPTAVELWRLPEGDRWVLGVVKDLQGLVDLGAVSVAEGLDSTDSFRTSKESASTSTDSEELAGVAGSTVA
jgi:hypothetical protein